MHNDLDILLAEIDLLKSQVELQQHRLDRPFNRAWDIEASWQNNNLENGKLTLEQTEMLIQLGLMPPDIPIPDNLATLNFFQALQFIREQANEQALLNEELLTDIHAILARGIDRKGAGHFSNQASASSKDASQELIFDTLHDLRLNGPFQHPIQFAAEAHLKLISLHPFDSFNGACARLAMNLVLLEEGFPPISILGDQKNRQIYFEKLKLALHDQDKSIWLHYIAEQVSLGLQALIARLDALPA